MAPKTKIEMVPMTVDMATVVVVTGCCRIHRAAEWALRASLIGHTLNTTCSNCSDSPVCIEHMRREIKLKPVMGEIDHYCRTGFKCTV